MWAHHSILRAVALKILITGTHSRFSFLIDCHFFVPALFPADLNDFPIMWQEFVGELSRVQGNHTGCQVGGFVLWLCICARVCVCVYMRARACVCESSTAWSDVTSIRAVDWELRVAVQVPCVQETDWLCLAKKKKEQRIFVRQRRRGANVMVENWESQQLKTKVAGHMWSFFYQALCCHVHCFWSKWSWPSPETLIPVQRGFAACFEGWTA